MNRKYQVFSKGMAVLIKLFNKKMEKQVTQAYWYVLKDYSEEQIQQAFNRALRECKFFPMPAQFIEFIEGNADEKAERAWIVLMDVIEKYGHYYSVVFEDGKIAKAVEVLGGWEYMCSLNIQQLNFKKKEFINIYKAINLKGPQKVTGFIERENFLKGQDDISYPLCIVDKNGNIQQKDKVLPEAKEANKAIKEISGQSPLNELKGLHREVWGNWLTRLSGSSATLFG